MHLNPSGSDRQRQCNQLLSRGNVTNYYHLVHSILGLRARKQLIYNRGMQIKFVIVLSMLLLTRPDVALGRQLVRRKLDG
jgi:hypothetical protein